MRVPNLAWKHLPACQVFRQAPYTPTTTSFEFLASPDPMVHSTETNGHHMPTVDLRSDTVTKPTDEMRQAMMTAEVGDDVYGEDSSVNKLQQYAATLTGKEAALFTPSGTMANLLAVLAQCGRGGEVILGDEAHIFHYEGGGISALACSKIRRSGNPRCWEQVPTLENGELSLAALDAAIKERPVDQHFAQPALLCIEQTHNRMGGRVLSLEYMRELAAWAKLHGLSVHCDGARLFNAAAALGVEIKDIAQHVTTMSFCLSKALGAPAGSLLVGPQHVIAAAHRLRKMVGGGMRQVGVLAAPGMLALQISPKLLPTDHANARFLADGLSGLKGLRLDPVESNIVIFRLSEGLPPMALVLDRLKQAGVLMGCMRGGIRAVTHSQVSLGDCRRAVAAVEEALSTAA